MDSPSTPRRRDLPEVPSNRASPALGSPSRQQYHLEELSNPYSPGHSSPTSPQRRPMSTLGSPTRQGTFSPGRSFGPSGTTPNHANSVHASPRNSPLREWSRFESPMRSGNEHTAIHIDDSEEEGDLAASGGVRWASSLDSTPPGPPPLPDFGSHNSRPRDSIASSITANEIVTLESDEEEIDEYEDDDDASYIEDDDADDAASNSSAVETLNSDEAYEAPLKSQPRRHKSMTRKEVKLVRGNLILDCPVPTKLYSFLPRRDNDEFVYMRYTACTSEPDDFEGAGFTLRPAIYGREVQLCVCITMYNEDEILFTRTLHSVIKNIAKICQRSKSRVWGKEGWKKIVVTIVSDGREKVNPRVLDVLSAMGVYQDGIAKSFVNGNPVKAHIFEYTTQVSLGSDLKFQGAEKGIVPVQILFCLKEKNQKKINSHRWLFNGFCPLLKPNVCILLDVGTKPGANTIYKLWKTFDADSNVGGACGEIKTMLGKNWRHLLNPLVAAQNFEYKMSNILDKPLESVFGYISVLPGALSAYRYRALQNLPDGTGPLASYFKGETLHSEGAGIFDQNMYLAEDRILCWELVAKRGEKWILKYVRSATGETDVPDTIPEFISQRRRWLNGALFAAIFSQTHFKQIWYTDHSLIRKIFFHVEFLYQFINLIFTFFSLANFYLAFYFVGGSLASSEAGAIGKNGGGLVIFLIFKYTCICVIASQFVLSLGNRPQGAKGLFTLGIGLLSAVALYSTCAGLYFVAKTISESSNGVEVGNNVFTTIIVSLASTYGLYAVTSILHMDPWHLITSSLQYFLLLPGYMCTLQIYALCNTHDVSWGTKGDNVEAKDLGSANFKSAAGKDIVEIEMPAEQLDIDSGYEEALHNLREGKLVPVSGPSASVIAMDYYREFRTKVVLVWMICNALLVLIMTQIFGTKNAGHNIYLQIILWSVAGMAAFRAVGSIAYLIQELVKYTSESTYKMNRFRANAFTGKS